jgi:hypothetical protein
MIDFQLDLGGWKTSADERWTINDLPKKFYMH